MTRKKFISACSLLAAMTMSIGAAVATDKLDKDPEHQLPRPAPKAADMTKPEKVFILMAQSTMVGMAEVGPQTC